MANFKPLEINDFLNKALRNSLINDCKLLDYGYRDHNFNSAYMYWAKIDISGTIINCAFPIFFEEHQTFDSLLYRFNQSILKASEVLCGNCSEDELSTFIIDNIRVMLRHVLNTPFVVENNFHYEDFVCLFLEELPDYNNLSYEEIFNKCMKEFTSTYKYDYYTKEAA